MNYMGDHINNAHDVFEWFKTHFSSNKVGTSSRMSQIVPCRVFWEISGLRMHNYIFKLFKLYMYVYKKISLIFMHILNMYVQMLIEKLCMLTRG